MLFQSFFFGQDSEIFRYPFFLHFNAWSLMIPSTSLIPVYVKKKKKLKYFFFKLYTLLTLFECGMIANIVLQYGLAQVKPFIKHEQIRADGVTWNILYYLFGQSVITKKRTNK